MDIKRGHREYMVRGATLYQSRPPSPPSFLQRTIIVELVICVLLEHPNSKIANSMKLVNFAFFSFQNHVLELKNIKGNLIALNSNQ